MAVLGTELPVVIQQADKASAWQEALQRGGEAQQLAAGQEMARQLARERQAVQGNPASGAENRIRSDQREAGAEGRKSPARRPPAQAQPPSRPADADDEGGILDVVA